LSDLTARYWQFWIGLLLVAIVLVGRERIAGIAAAIEGLLARMLRRDRGAEARAEKKRA